MEPSQLLRSKKALDIIFLTDYHMKKDLLPKLKLWHNQQLTNSPPLKIDLVIFGGDFDNLQIYEKDPNHEEYVMSEARMTDFFEYLGFFGAPIFYVPGNHDAAGLFYSKDDTGIDSQLTDNSFNCHKRVFNIGKNLWIAGLGGSCPGKTTFRKNGESEPLWVGFPYETDQDCKADIDVLDKNI